ncbi:MAG: acyl-CoA dehydrogenase family protein [Planctomycetota bacterium]|jgi:alkylation response protein AidB-like acyl-CoA dehydrogenase
MGERRIDHYLGQLLDEERFEFYRAVADFADREIAPQLLGWERAGGYVSDELIAQLGEMGIFGIPIPEEHGGQGGGLTELALMGLALGYQSHSVAITPGAALSLGANPILNHGTTEQKEAHLADLATGSRMVVFGLSEPGRGSDAANPEVVAERTDTGWVLRGEKCWSTNARWASHVIVHAMTDPDGRNGHRSTCFIVPMDDPNVHYSEMSGKTVWTLSSTGSIVLDQVSVSEDQILGELNEGFKVMVTTLNGGRLFIASLALASLAFALDRVRTYVQEREQFGGPIARFQRVQDVVLEMDLALDRNLTWLITLLDRYAAGRLDREQASKVKIDCSRAASRLLLDAMEICGGVAGLDEFGLSRHHNDLFVTRVGEGSNRALMTQIARGLLPDCGSILQ